MPYGLKRFQRAEALHFVTFNCFHRLPFLEAPEPKKTVEHYSCHCDSITGAVPPGSVFGTRDSTKANLPTGPRNLSTAAMLFKHRAHPRQRQPHHIEVASLNPRNPLPGTPLNPVSSSLIQRLARLHGRGNLGF